MYTISAVVFQKKTESPRSSPVQFKDNHMLEQQLKVESMQKELQEKEKYLKALRTKGLKNGLKSEYVHRLELRVMEQEEQLKSMRSLEEELFKYQVDNEKLSKLQKYISMERLKSSLC